MQRANTLGETEIPDEPDHDPGSASARAALVAIARLMVFVGYVWLMTALGYEIRRVRAPRPSPSPAPCSGAARRPRRVHRYLDRNVCLALLAQANHAAREAFAAAPPSPDSSLPLSPACQPGPDASSRRPAARKAAPAAGFAGLASAPLRRVPLLADPVRSRKLDERRPLRPLVHPRPVHYVSGMI